eukprot:CAMPEP_0119181076 /NCGR_PEP_ID=MMETSP1315-20130426/58515_1 /TAXON_ID=676789 /ORGANISM="Prasinoderma singularis, Strain RCC927" /LENGTH=51 /DNA_ID=CAMNT_0007175377 /DNA_START=108 /DNA_END=263 /DNA_ORIENTATION=+
MAQVSRTASAWPKTTAPAGTTSTVRKVMKSSSTSLYTMIQSLYSTALRLYT